jgi:hypothetical protein
VVRRILAVRYQPTPDAAGPSWLAVLGHAKDSLWSVDLFRCDSAVLRAHWVLVVMDHFTRRIVGFDVHRGAVGPSEPAWRALLGLTPVEIPRCGSSERLSSSDWEFATHMCPSLE